MDWLEAHRVNLNCYNKTFEYMDEEGNPRFVRAIPKVILVRHISTMQLKKCYRKGCRVYATHVLEAMENETIRLEDYPILQEFRDVFPDEIPGLSPRRTLNSQLNLCQN